MQAGIHNHAGCRTSRSVYNVTDMVPVGLTTLRVGIPPDRRTLPCMAVSFHSKSEPASPAVPLRGGSEDARKPKPARRTLYLAGLLFVVAFAWSSGLLDKAAALGVQFFDLYAQSQLAMLKAAGNVADGRAEYAVLLHGETSVAALQAEIEPMTTMRYERESAIPGWVVVSVEDGDRDALAALKSAHFSRYVVPNRGLWICH